ncbi:MAG: CDP-alcohol phosphatidyltransferase family protein [Candidatus Saccharimonadales bacterium]
MHKSLYDRFIPDPRAAEVKAELIEPSDRILTPATLITAIRPILGAMATKKLLAGEKGVFKLTALMGLTDFADGKLSRWIDKHYPESTYGTSKFGASADTMADVTSLAPVGLSMVVAKRIPITAKLGIGAVLSQEGSKGGWAFNANNQYKEAGGEGQLFIQPTKGGKAAMAEKFTSFGLAALANECENPIVRSSLGVASFYFGVTGALRGNEAVGQYKQEAAQLIGQLQTSSDMPEQTIVLS